VNLFVLKAMRLELDALAVLIDELDQALIRAVMDPLSDPFEKGYLAEEHLAARVRWQHLTSELAASKALTP
jgi:hypothetical protein